MQVQVRRYCKRRIVNQLPHMVFDCRSKRDFHRTIFQALQVQYRIDLCCTVVQYRIDLHYTVNSTASATFTVSYQSPSYDAALQVGTASY